jgi:hypothetical protein
MLVHRYVVLKVQPTSLISRAAESGVTTHGARYFGSGAHSAPWQQNRERAEFRTIERVSGQDRGLGGIC